MSFQEGMEETTLLLSSFLFSESMAYHADRVTVDADDVETDTPVDAPVLLQIDLGGTYDVRFFSGVYGIERRAETAAPASFDLDKDKTAALFGDDVDLSEGASEVRVEDAVALPYQNGRRSVLSFPPCRQFIRHSTPSPP